MKNNLIVLIAAALLLGQNLKAQTDSIVLVPKVDKRVELLSIVFRLAGSDEYNMSNLKKYTSDIDDYFRDFKDHPVIQFAKQLRAERGVSFDAVMGMAVHLSQPPDLNPIVEFSDTIPEQRWGKSNALKFVALLQEFYRDAHFERFFETHRELYREVEHRFQGITQNVDLPWYKHFYGEMPKGTFNLLIGVNNGGGNYGPRVVFPDGREELFSIIGAGRIDSTGMPVFGKSSLPTIIHEFNHSFVNPVVDAHFEKFAAAVQTVFEPVAQQMERMAYGDSRTMLKESLVRAAVISYFQTHANDSATVGIMIKEEQANGFVWMDELYSLLSTYESRRSEYPTFESFMPAVVSFYTGLASRIQTKMQLYDSRCVHVTSIEPFDNKSQSVDTATTEIIVHLDKALDPTKGYSIGYSNGGKEHYPVVGRPMFLNSNTAIKVRVQLKPEWDYSFVLLPLAFESVDGYPLKTYTIEFRTKK
jgi:hypothetical protein